MRGLGRAGNDKELVPWRVDEPRGGVRKTRSGWKGGSSPPRARMRKVCFGRCRLPTRWLWDGPSIGAATPLGLWPTPVAVGSGGRGGRGDGVVGMALGAGGRAGGCVNRWLGEWARWASAAGWALGRRLPRRPRSAHGVAAGGGCAATAGGACGRREAVARGAPRRAAATVALCGNGSGGAFGG